MPPSAFQSSGSSSSSGVEASSYAARMVGAGSSIDSRTLGLLDDLVTTAKAQGWWSAVLEFYPMCGPSLAGALQKLKHTGVASLTNHNLVEADFSQERGIGVVSGNSNKWLATGFIPADQGVTTSDFGLIVSATHEAAAAGAGSGKTIGDNISGNSGECGYWFGMGGGIGIGSKTAYWSPASQASRVCGYSSATGNVQHAAADGVSLFNSSGGATNVTLDGEMGILKCVRFSGERYENGVIGCVIFTTYLTPTLLRQATAAVAKFERAIRGVYRSGNDGVIGFGDSVTAWPASFAEIVSTRLGMRLSNFGNPSAKLTAAALGPATVDIVADVAARPERTVLLGFGTNDGVSGVSGATFTTALNTVVAALIAEKKRVVICSPAYSSDGTYNGTVQRDYAGRCATAALTYGCHFADTNRVISDLVTPGDAMLDTTHPNAAGHLLMSGIILAALRGQQVRQLTLNLASVALGDTEETTVEVLTARPGQVVTLALPTAIENGLTFTAFVSANDTVTIRYLNNSGVLIDPASGIFTISVFSP